MKIGVLALQGDFDAHRKRLEERIETLSRKVGFRIGPGLRDRPGGEEFPLARGKQLDLVRTVELS